MIKQFTNHQQLKYNKEYLINLTNDEIPDEIKTLISYGPKFTVPIANQRIPMKHLLADVEYVVQLEKNEDLQDQLRSRAVNVMSNFLWIKNNKPINELEKRLVYMYKQTLGFFKKHSNLVVVASDKGNKSVIMYKSEYEQKIKLLLNDTNTYSIIDIDPTKKLQNKNNTIVRKMYQNKFINEKTKKLLLMNKSICPRLYGNPKIHKEGYPLRPIVSSINSPSYDLSKWIGTIINSVIDHDVINIKNSYEFRDFITEQEIKSDHILVSFDVISLFTNIPLELVMTIVTKNWEIIENITPIPIEMFLKITKFCVNECNYFKCLGNIYQQQFGCAMGNPLSPILANLIMDDLIKTQIHKTYPNIPFFKKYVDDCITYIPQEMIEPLLIQLNSYHPRIQFTYEIEDNQQLPFLDILIIKNTRSGTFITNWFKKKLASDRILNYHSYHHTRYKINTAKELIHRVVTLSDRIFWATNRTEIINILTKNNYPLSLTYRLLREKTGINNPIKIIITKPLDDTMIYCSMKYIRGLSENLMKLFTTHFDNIKISTKSIITLQGLYTKTKEKIHHTDKSDVIYQIPCNDCNVTYIGQTGRNLKIRIAEHKTDQEKILAKIGNLVPIEHLQIPNNMHNHSPHTPQLHSPLAYRNFSSYTASYSYKKDNKSALIQHVENKNHAFNFDNTKILETQPNLKKRLFIEACEIKNSKNACNLRTDIDKLSVSYINLLKRKEDTVMRERE